MDNWTYSSELGIRFWVMPGNGSPMHLDKLKDTIFYVGQLQCFSSKGDRTSSAQDGSCLYILLFTRLLAAFLWVSIFSLTDHSWSASPAQSGCARVRTLFSWRPRVCAATQFTLAGQYHTWWMRTQTYKFSWFPVYGKASMKETVNPLLCGSLPGSAYEYCFIFLLLLTWGLKFSWDLPHLIKSNWSIAYLLSATKDVLREVIVLSVHISFTQDVM